MEFSVDVGSGRLACADSVVGFLDAVDGMSEYDLLDSSRCHGWSRLDVVVHVLAGWQEMLGGFVSVVDAEPTVDAASYWSEFATDNPVDDPVPLLMAQHRRSAAYARPASATKQLHDVGEALLRGVQWFGDQRCEWQGYVFAPGDFLGIWAVENVIHHLDLRSELPAPASGLRLARGTIEALVGEQLPSSWSDLDVTLMGSGRLPVPDHSEPVARRLPVLG